MSPPVYAAAPLSHQLQWCAQAVMAVRGGQSLSQAILRVPPPLRPGVQALAFHVMRWLGAAETLQQQLVPRRPPAPLEGLLLCSLALLWPESSPPYADHTLVDQAVQAASRAGRASAAGLVNAVLRRFLRERDQWVAAARLEPRARWNHPPWWIHRLRADWPAQAEGILASAQARPPMFLRVNARRTTATRYVELLGRLGRKAREAPPGSGLEQLVLVEEPCPVDALPGFAAGDVSVQDAAAQRAAPCLLASGLPAGARVLDACSAPGGKAAHLLELADLDLLALDVDEERLARVHDTFRRLGLSAQARQGDATQPQGWWDGRPFDAILLDAPCSASGIVRRHPDVRWLRRPADIASLGQVQAHMLDALWPLLRPGGRLLFATCSVFKAEGEHQIDAFLQRQPLGTAHLDGASPGHMLPLPDNPGPRASDASLPSGDGFFYALLHKR